MFSQDLNAPIQTYKSYKAEKFEKYLQRQKALIRGVKDSSLKEEDKKLLIKKMIELSSMP